MTTLTYDELRQRVPTIIETKRATVGSVAPSSFNAAARTVDCVLTKRVVDHDRELIEPKAFEATIDVFKSNPAVLFAHSSKTIPVGRVLPESIVITDEEIVGTIKFRDKGKSKEADEVVEAILDGSLRGVSIGFVIHSVKRERWTDGGEVLRITSGTLLELSVVPIPANPQALFKGLMLYPRSKQQLADDAWHAENAQRPFDLADDVHPAELHAARDALAALKSAFTGGRREAPRGDVVASLEQLSRKFRQAVDDEPVHEAIAHVRRAREALRG